MEIRVFYKLPVYAVDIRKEVFVKEQGFKEEFDGDDKRATHIVGFIDGKSVATARILENPDGSFLIGRIAVRKEFRGKGLGADIIAFAEQVIFEAGGRKIFIHSQHRAIPFYEKQGYCAFGEPDMEEDHPHQMMIKVI